MPKSCFPVLLLIPPSSPVVISLMAVVVGEHVLYLEKRVSNTK